MQRMEFQARSPATTVQLLLHVQDSAENACSVRTGYVFFGTLVLMCVCVIACKKERGVYEKDEEKNDEKRII